MSAAFAHGTLFVGGGQTPDGFPGSVVALDPATGTQKWVFHPGGFVLGALTAAGDTVIATATDASTYAGTVYVLDQSSGSILFQMSGAGMLGEATFAGGTLYVGDLNGALFALQPTGICRN